jgi:hypothetical protein
VPELEAEAVACVAGEAIGLHVAEAARDYIQLYRDDREALLRRSNAFKRRPSSSQW